MENTQRHAYPSLNDLLGCFAFGMAAGVRAMTETPRKDDDVDNRTQTQKEEQPWE